MFNQHGRVNARRLAVESNNRAPLPTREVHRVEDPAYREAIEHGLRQMTFVSLAEADALRDHYNL